MNGKYMAFIGTNSVRGSRGIYSVAIDAETYRAETVSAYQAYNTGTLALGSNGKLYAGIEGMTFEGLADGGVRAFSFDKETGDLTQIGAVRSHGQRTCSISVDAAAKNLYAANFYDGTMAMYALDEDGVPQNARCVVPGKDVPGAHKALHCVCAVGKDYVGVISLTECALIIYSAKDGKRITAYEFPGKPFCRYLESCGEYLYALMQHPGDIYVFKNNLDESGTIEMIQRTSVLREGDPAPEHYGTTTIRKTPDNRLMLAATRSTSTITVYRIKGDGTLELGDIVKLPAPVPRDFGISQDGQLVVAALQQSDQVSVHRIDYENATLKDIGVRLAIPSPAAVAVYGRYE